MKIIKSLITTTSILLVTGAVFANNDCPPLNVVLNAKFTKASEYFKDWWVLKSDAYTYHGKTWQTEFGFAAYFENDQEALRQGIVSFKSLVNDFNPAKIDSSNNCSYADSYDYGLIAKVK